MALILLLIDKVKYENYSIHPVVNGLSDHDAQIIAFNNITVDKHISKTQNIRKFNKFSLSQFAVIFFPFYYLLPKIEIYVNRIQKFIISTPDLVLIYIHQLPT
jgi:hypothetical protein